VTEANTFREGWGQIIFQSASEIVQNERTKESYARILRAKAAQDAKPKKRAKGISPAPPALNGTPSKVATPLPATAQAAVLNGASSQIGSDSDSPVKSPVSAQTPASSSAKKGKRRK